MSAKTYVYSISSHQMKYSFTTLKTLLVLFFFLVFSSPGQVVKMFQYTIWRLAKATKADFTLHGEKYSVNLESSHCTVISVSHNLRAETSQPQHSLMYAIRNDEKWKKKLSLVLIHFAIYLFFRKLLLKYFFFHPNHFFSFLFLSVSLFFFCCNLNGKPPDVCLMLEESEICIIQHINIHRI